jgi:hypothetical protein
MLYVEIDKRELDLALKLIPQQLKMELGDAFDHIGRKFVKTLGQTRMSGRPGIKAQPKGLFRRLQRTMFVPTGGIMDMGTEIYFDSKVALLHELGGKVTGQGGKKLAVPLSARREMFTAGGALRQAYKRPRGVKGLNLIYLKNKYWLAKRLKKLKSVVSLYVLKRSVKIPPRLQFFKTWDTMENQNMQRINLAIERALKKV